MKLKDLVNKSFMFTKNIEGTAFSESLCYGLKIGNTKESQFFGGERATGLIFVGCSHIENEVYCAVLTKEWLEECLIDRRTIAISNNSYKGVIIKKMFDKGINEYSFKAIGLI